MKANDDQHSERDELTGQGMFAMPFLKRANFSCFDRMSDS